MTVFAYKNGMLVADGITMQGDIRVALSRKIARGPDGTMAVSPGLATDCQTFERWVEAGRPDPWPRISDDFYGYTIEPDGSVRAYDSLGNYAELGSGPMAGGIGREIAHGVMAFGGTALDAVTVAIELMPSCGGPVQVEYAGEKRDAG